MATDTFSNARRPVRSTTPPKTKTKVLYELHRRRVGHAVASGRHLRNRTPAERATVRPAFSSAPARRNVDARRRLPPRCYSKCALFRGHTAPEIIFRAFVKCFLGAARNNSRGDMTREMGKVIQETLARHAGIHPRTPLLHARRRPRRLFRDLRSPSPELNKPICHGHPSRPVGVCPA